MPGPDRAGGAPSPSVCDAPVMRPTRAQMDNFDAYLDKYARPEAQVHGGVLIVPPEDWVEPELRLKDDTKFYTRKQRLPACPPSGPDGQRLLTECLTFPYSDRLISVKNFRKKVLRADEKLLGKLFELGRPSNATAGQDDGQVGDEAADGASNAGDDSEEKLEAQKKTQVPEKSGVSGNSCAKALDDDAEGPGVNPSEAGEDNPAPEPAGAGSDRPLNEGENVVSLEGKGAEGEPSRRVRKKPDRLSPMHVRSSGPSRNVRQNRSTEAKATDHVGSGPGEDAGPTSGSGGCEGAEEPATHSGPVGQRTIEDLENAFWGAMVNGVDGQGVDLSYGVDVEAEGAYDAHIANYVHGAPPGTGGKRARTEPNSEPASPALRILPDAKPNVNASHREQNVEGGPESRLELGVPSSSASKAGENAAGSTEGKSGPRWHIGNINQSSLLQHLPPMPGISHPMFYVGHLFTRFCWHVEDAFLNSISYLHRGSADKVWYVVPPDDADILERYAAEHVFSESLQAGGKNGQTLLGGKTTLFDPRDAAKCGVPVYRIVHKPGTFVYTAPRAYHGGFNTGFNVAEAVNYATASWFPVGRVAAECMRNEGVQMPVPFEYLLYRKAWQVVARNNEVEKQIRAKKREATEEKEVLSRDARVVAEELSHVIKAGEAAVRLLVYTTPCRILEDVRFGAPPTAARRNGRNASRAASSRPTGSRPTAVPSRSTANFENSLSAILNAESCSGAAAPALDVVRHKAELDGSFGNGAGMRCTVCQHLSHFFIAVCDTCPNGGEEARCPRHFLARESTVCGKDGHKPVVLRRHNPVEIWDLISNLEYIAGIETSHEEMLKRFTQYVRPWQVRAQKDKGEEGCFLGPGLTNDNRSEGFVLQRCVDLSSRRGPAVRERSKSISGKDVMNVEGSGAVEDVVCEDDVAPSGPGRHVQEIAEVRNSVHARADSVREAKDGSSKHLASRPPRPGRKTSNAKANSSSTPDDMPAKSTKQHRSAARRSVAAVQAVEIEEEIEDGGSNRCLVKRRTTKAAKESNRGSDDEDAVDVGKKTGMKDSTKKRASKNVPEVEPDAKDEDMPRTKRGILRKGVKRSRTRSVVSFSDDEADDEGSIPKVKSVRGASNSDVEDVVGGRSDRLKRRKTKVSLRASNGGTTFEIASPELESKRDGVTRRSAKTSVRVSVQTGARSASRVDESVAQKEVLKRRRTKPGVTAIAVKTDEVNSGRGALRRSKSTSKSQ